MIKISHLILPGKSQNLHFEKKGGLCVSFLEQYIILDIQVPLQVIGKSCFEKKNTKREALY